MNDEVPRVRLVRRPSDFHRRPTHLLQAGTTTTCCTCCFVWVGAALGGSLGLVHGWRAFRGTTTVAAVHRRRILIAYAAAILALIAIFVGMYLGQVTMDNSPALEALIGGLAVFSSLIFLLPGMFALVIAWWSTRRSESEERAAVRSAVCRLIWMSFNYANLGWIVCLGVLLGLGPEKFHPVYCFVGALVTAAVVLIAGAWWNRRAIAKTPAD